MGRSTADITKWVEYFCDGMAISFESVKKRAVEASGSGEPDHSMRLRQLDARQRKSLVLFQESHAVTSRDVAGLFAISERTARNLLADWLESGFIIIDDPAKKSRKYRLSGIYESLIK